jgi:prepilin-type N-terminal cleavage/methylation domain-containing protein
VTRLQAARARRDESGFTLIELLVAMVIVTTLSTMAVGGWLRYQHANEQRGTAQEIVSSLRNAQQRALAEAVTYCMSFDAANRSYRLYKYSCGAGGTAVGSAHKTSSVRVTLATPSFQQADGTLASTVSFLPRGSATKGSVVIGRQDGSKKYTVTVEGLTGRVSLTG